MENISQYILSGAEVIVNAEEPAMNAVSYPKCCTSVDRKHNRVVVSPIVEHRIRNKKIFESGRMKVLTRKDGTYMLYFNIHAQEDWADLSNNFYTFEEALDETCRYDARLHREKARGK